MKLKSQLNGKMSHNHGWEDIMSIPRAIYRFNTDPGKILITFFTQIGNAILKLTQNHKRSQVAQNSLNKKNKTIGITLPDFKIYYKAVAIKTEWYCHKIRHTGQWNRKEGPEVNPGNIWSTIFFTRVPRMERVMSSRHIVAKAEHMQKKKRIKLGHKLTSSIQIYPTWIKNINLKPETIKLTEGNTEKLTLSLAMIF
jgi:hypothetical protein